MTEPMWSRQFTAWSRSTHAAGQPETTIALRAYHLSRIGAALRTPPSAVTAEQLLTWLSGQELLEHARPESTAIYTAIDREDIRAAVNAVA